MITIMVVMLIILSAVALYLVFARFFFNRLGQAERYYRLGQVDKSISILREDLEKNPNDHAARWFLASLLYEQGDYSEAVAFSKPLVLKPPPGEYFGETVAVADETPSLDRAATA